MVSLVLYSHLVCAINSDLVVCVLYCSVQPPVAMYGTAASEHNWWWRSPAGGAPFEWIFLIFHRLLASTWQLMRLSNFRVWSVMSEKWHSVGVRRRSVCSNHGWASLNPGCSPQSLTVGILLQGTQSSIYSTLELRPTFKLLIPIYCHYHCTYTVPVLFPSVYWTVVLYIYNFSRNLRTASLSLSL